MNIWDLVADGKVLDTYGDLDISLNLQLDQILDISKRPGGWTKTIIIPGSPINDEFFRYSYNCNIDKKEFNINKKISCYLRVGDNVVFRGWIQLLDIFILHNKVEYSVSLSSIVSSITDQLGDVLLKDYIDLSDFNHIRNKDNIIDSFYNDYRDGYVYPYIVYGESNDIYHNWYVYGAFPAVFIRPMVERVFKKLGINLQSKFFESEYFNKLIMPYVNDPFQFTDEEFTKRSSLIGFTNQYNLATQTQSTGDFFNYGPSFTGYNSTEYGFALLDRESGTVDENGSEITFTDGYGQFDVGTGVWTCVNTGYYDINVNIPMYAEYTSSVDIEYNPSASLYFNGKLWVQRVGQTFAQASMVDSTTAQEFFPSSGLHPSPWLDTATPLSMDLNASKVFLSVGDRVFVTYLFRKPTEVEWNGTSAVQAKLKMIDYEGSTGEFAKFEVVLSSNLSTGLEDVKLNDCVPNNYKVVDFLQDLTSMFNLITTNDLIETDTIIIEPRDDYFGSRVNILNWEKDKKLDYDQGVKLEPMSQIDSNKYLFTYDDDSDYYNREYNKEYKETYGQVEISVENDYSNSVNTTRLGLGPSPNSQRFIGDRVAPFLCDIEDDLLVQSPVKPRILFYGGVIEGNYLYLRDYPEQTTGEFIYQYPYCGMWDNPYTPTNTLEFNQSKRIYWETGTFSNNNLYNKFYRSTINDIVNNNNSVLEGYFYLTTQDVANFDFRSAVFLDGQYWRVLEIVDYNPVLIDKPTKVRLTKILDYNLLSKDILELPISNSSCPLDGVLKKVGNEWYYISSSGQTITEDCCTSVGGVFIGGACKLDFEQNPDKKGRFRAPIVDKNGPYRIKDNNTVNSSGVFVRGRGNYVGEGVSNTNLALGDNISFINDIQNTFVIGTAVSPTYSNSIYINNNVLINSEFDAYVFNDEFFTQSGPTSSNENYNVLGLTMSNIFVIPQDLWIVGPTPSINGIPFPSGITGSNGWPEVLAIDNTSGGLNPILTNNSSIGGGEEPATASAVNILNLGDSTVSNYSWLLGDRDLNNSFLRYVNGGDTQLYNGTGNININLAGSSTGFIQLDSNGLGYDQAVVYLTNGLFGQSYLEFSSYTGAIYSFSTIDTTLENNNNQLILQDNATTLWRNTGVGDQNRLQFTNGLGYAVTDLFSRSDDSELRIYVTDGAGAASFEIFLKDNTTNTVTSPNTNSKAVFIGTNNSIIGVSSINNVVVGGNFNEIYGDNSVIVAGESSIINSDNAGMLGVEGSTLQSNAQYSAIIGAQGITGTFPRTVYQQDSYRDGGNHTVQTSNTTITDLYSFTPDSNGVWIIEANVTGFASSNGNAIGEKTFAVFKVIAGVVTQVSTTTVDRKSNFLPVTTVTVDTNGTNIRVRVTGALATVVDWRGSITITK